MAWRAPRPSKRPPTNSNGAQGLDTSFPGLKPATPDAAARIEYQELQQNEVLALEAIYAQDFVKHSGAHSAWKVCTCMAPDLAMAHGRAAVTALLPAHGAHPPSHAPPGLLYCVCLSVCVCLLMPRAEDGAVL